jgi:uncharacterized repeat protein (TIGR01451 family)
MLNTLIRRMWLRPITGRKPAPVRRQPYPLGRRIEALEDRTTPANLTDSGTATLTIHLDQVGEALSVVSNGATYTFTTSDSGGFTNGGVANPATDFDAFGNTTITLTAAGLVTYDTISVVDDSTGNAVAFADSSPNTYSDNISVLLNDAAAGPVTFTGATALTGSNTFSATTAANIVVNAGALVGTADGGLTLSANPAAGPGTFVGVDVNGGVVQATGTGTVAVSGIGGTDAGGGQSGVVVRAGGAISGGTAGTSTVIGTGGANAGGFNAGVLVDGGTITSAGGDISVSGTGGDGATGDDYGVWVTNGGTITSGGDTSVAGTGSTGGGGDRNWGVRVDSVSTVTSAGGAVSVTGTGGGLAGSINNDGISVNGTVSAPAAGGSLTLTGTGGAGGVAGGSEGIALEGGGVVTTAATGTPLDLVADVLFIDPTASVTAGTGTVTVRQLTNGVGIDLGGNDVDGTALGLVGAELSAITAGGLQIGNANTGPIAVSSAITATDLAGVTTLMLIGVTGAAGVNLSADVTTANGTTLVINPAVTLGADVALSTGAGDIDLLAGVNGGFALALNSTGSAVLGAVGAGVPLTSLTTDAGGDTDLQGGSVTTTGGQTYNDAVSFPANTTLTSTGGGNIALASTVDGGFTLAVNTTGTTTFGGAVGGTTPLTSLTTDAGGTTALNVGGFIKTTGGQTYNDAVTLGANTSPQSTGGGAIEFASTVDGGFNLAVFTAGTTTFGGVVGGSVPLAFLATDVAGTAQINADVTTTGGQLLNDPITLGGNVNFTSTLGTVDILGGLSAGANDLTVSAGSFNLGAANSITGTGTVTLRAPTAADNLTVAAADFAALANGFSQINIGRADGTGTIILGTGATIAFADPVVVNQQPTGGGDVFINSPIVGTGNASFTVNGSGNTTTLNADVTMPGTPIVYHDAVVLGTPGTITLDTTGGGAFPGGAAITIDSPGTVDDDVLGSTVLVLNAGTGGAVSIAGLVGGTVPVAGLTVTNAGSVSLGGDVAATGAVSLTAQNAVDTQGIAAAAGPITVNANQDGAGAEGFTQNGGTYSTTNATANAVAITVGGAGDAALLAISTGAGGRITVAAGGAITQAAGTLSGGEAALSAANGIGSGAAIQTAVGSLAFQNTSAGDVNVTNTGALSVAPVGALVTSFNAAGGGAIRASGGLSVDTDTSFAAAFTLEAVGSAAAGDDLTVNANVVQTGVGTTTLRAGDNVAHNAGLILNPGGTVSFNADTEGDGSGGIAEDTSGGSTASLVAGSAVFRSFGPVLYTGATPTSNSAGTVAGTVAQAGQPFAFRNDGILTVGSVTDPVGTQDGIQTLGGTALLVTDGDLALDQPVNTINGAVLLVAQGSVTQTATGLITGGIVGVRNDLAGSGDITLTQPGNEADSFAAFNAFPGGTTSFTEATGFATTAIDNTLSGPPYTLFATTTGVTTADGDVNLQTGGALLLNTPVNAGTAAANLTAGTTLTQSGAGVTVTAGPADLVAPSGIGTGGQSLMTSVTTLSTDSSGNNGPQFIREANGVTLQSLVAGSGAITVAATAGDVGVVSVGTTGSVSLSADVGSILDDGNNGTVIGGNVVSLTASGEIGQPGATANIDTAATSLSLSAGDVSGLGAHGIWVTDADAVTVTNATTTDGVIVLGAGGTMTATSVTAFNATAARAVALTTTAGDILVGFIQAAGPNPSNVRLSAAGAVSDNNGPGATNVVAAGLGAQAGTGVALDTQVATLAATSTAGDVSIANTGGLTTNAVAAIGVTVNGVSTTGNVNLTATGPLTLTQTVSAGIVGGTAALTAGTAITQTGAGTAVTGDSIALTAPNGIGTGLQPLVLDGNNLRTSTGASNGDQFLAEVNTVTVPVGQSLAASAGTIALTAGTFLVDGSATSPIVVGNGATLGGTGATQAVTVNAGGTLAPGDSPGIIRTGDLALTAGGSYDVELDGTTAGTGYDQTQVNGTVGLGGATLNVTLGFTPTFGDAFTIIDNDGSDPVTGTFAGLPEGATFTVGASLFQVTYQGGTGNDVVLTTIDAASPALVGTPGDDLFIARQNGTNLEVLLNGNLIFSAPVASVTSLSLDGLAGNDTFDVDYAFGGFFPTPVSVDGATGFDTLQITGGSFGTTVYTFTNATDGTIQFFSAPGSVGPLTTIAFGGLDPIVNSGDTVDAVFNLPATPDFAVLEDNGAGQTRLRSVSGTFETASFDTPTGTLTVNGNDGNDTLSFTGVDASATPTVVLNGNNGDDTFTVTAGAINAPVTVSGGPNDTATPGDLLAVDTTGTANPFLTITGTGPTGLSGTYTFAAQPTITFDTIETLTPSAVDVSVTKDDGVTTATPGGTVTYTITVTNNSAIGINGVTVTDNFPAAITGASYTTVATPGSSSGAPTGSGNIADTVSLAAGGSVTYTVVAAIDPAAVGTLSNTASAFPPAGVTEPVPANNTATDTDTLTPQADLSVTKTDSPDPVIAGDPGNLTYTITVSTAGLSDAHAVQLTDALPAGTTFVSATAPVGWAVTPPPAGANGTFAATIADLAASAGPQVFTVTVHVDPSVLDAAVLSNTATVSSPDDTTPANNSATTTTTVNAAADLTVTKADSPDPVIAGTDLTYTITVANNGPSDAQTVDLIDMLPAGTTLVSFTLPAGWTDTSTPGTASATIATLAPGAGPQTFTLVVHVAPSVPNNTPLSNIATVTSATTEANPGDEIATATTTVNVAADLSVTKTDSPDPATAGDPGNLTYTITVANNGPSDAQTVSLSDLLPTGTTLVSFVPAVGWTDTSGLGTASATIATLAAGSGPQVFTLVVHVDPSVLDGTILSNTATVSSATTEANPGDETATADTTVNAQADLSVTKSDTPDPVTAGTDLTYTITVNAAGPSDAQSVVLSDALPAGTTLVSFTLPAGWTDTSTAGTASATIGTLAAGSGPQVFTLVVTVGPSVLNGTTLTNSATVSSATTDTNPANDTGRTTTAVVASADLSVTKAGAPDPVTAGTDLTYTITVNAAGPSDAQSVVLSDALPAGTTLVSFTLPAGWTDTSTAGTASATIGTLAASAGPQTFTLVVHVAPGTLLPAITNTATVTSATTDPNPADNTVITTTGVTTSADLTVTKTGSPDPAIAGDPADLTYTITVDTAGPSDAQTVQLVDVLPAGTTFVSIAAPAGWVVNTPAVGNNGTVTAIRPTLAAGTATQTFTITVHVLPSVLDGMMLSNTATVSAATTDPNPADNSATADTTVNASTDLSVTKTGSPDPVIAGTDLTYTIILANAGPSDAQTVNLTDALPAGTTFVSFTAPAGWTNTTPAVGGTGTVTASIPTVAAGATPVFTLVVHVLSSVADGTILSNTAAVATATTDTNSANDSITADTAVSASADLSVTKAGSPDPVFTGQDLTYTITVDTAGPSDAQGVQLSDLLPAGTTFVSFATPAGWVAVTPAVGGTGPVTATRATLAAGTATQTFTLVVHVGTAVPDGTNLSNTATVSSATTDPTPGNDSATATTLSHTTADLSVTVTDSPDPVRADRLLTYTITVTNGGTSDAQGIQLSNAVPAHTTFVSFTAPAGWASVTPAAGGTGAVTASIPTVAAGASATFTLVVRVNPGTPVTTVITDTATVTSATFEPTPAGNTATTTTTVTGAILPVVVGAGAGAPRVRVLDPVTLSPKFDFFAYDPRFFGEVRVAAGDVTGDGVADIVTSTGPGGGPNVKVFDGVTGQQVRSFFAYDANFRGGVFVGAGDVNGDGFADVITGAGPGAGPHVKVFSGKDGSQLASFFAYAPSFNGGVTVAAGDVDGDGKAEIITGASDGGSSHVKVFSQNLTELRSFFAFDSFIRGGVFVAAGDLDGDGKAEIITGNGQTAAEVKVFGFDGVAGVALKGTITQNADTFRHGTRVAVADRGADGLLDVVTGAGPGSPPVAQVFDGRTLAGLDSFDAFDGAMTGGVYVG